MARRRRGARSGPPPPVPGWLATFTLGDWFDPAEPVPLVEQVEMDCDGWRCVRAHGRWQAAGTAWLAESGLDASPVGWRRAVDPAHWGADPHRLVREVRRGTS